MLVREVLVHAWPVLDLGQVLAGFEALDDRVLSTLKMLRRVLVRRVVATADVPARQAESQMHPLRASRQTLLASFRRAWGGVMSLIEMHT